MTLDDSMKKVIIDTLRTLLDSIESGEVNIETFGISQKVLEECNPETGWAEFVQSNERTITLSYRSGAK